MSGAERLVGSVLFTDLVGFTDYNDCSGDEAAVAVLDAQREVVDSAIAAAPGSRLVKELGDGLMLWTPTPSAAIDLAVAFRRGMTAARVAGRLPLRVRVGVHHGPVIARGDDLVGQTVNIAARIVAIAGPDEILVSDDALAECPDLPAASRVGPTVVKGVGRPVWLHRLE